MTGAARSTDRPRRRPLFGALEQRIFLTIVVGLLPLAVLAFTTLVQNAERHKSDLLASSQRLMAAVVSNVDSELAAALSALDALAASPRLARDDFAAFHREALELLERRPSWASVVLSDSQARQLVNTYLPLGAPLPSRVAPESIAETVRTGEPGITDIAWSPVLETYAFAVRVPILREGRVAYVLSAVMRPESMQRFLFDRLLGEDTVAVIVDHQYNVVARTAGQADYVGKPASSTLLELLRAHTSGWSITSTLEGVPVYTIFYRSPETGWAAAYGIPTSAIDGPVRRSYALLGGTIVACLVLGVAAALLLSRSITRPMRELEAAAVAVGDGRAPRPPETELPEIRRVAAALAGAHAALDAVLQSERSARDREREARLLAEEASRTKDEFLAMLGHELRNPLAALASASIVLERSVANAAPNNAILESSAIVGRQTRHLARLTDDLLDTARLVMGRVQLERRPVDLALLVQTAVDAFRSTERFGEHRVSVDLQPVWVSADATRIDQIVTNLLTNAVKYTPPGGAIAVTLERDGADAVLRVSDTGVGIEPDLLPRIFELFVQGERSIDRALGGLGIGLTLVRRLTELHGGEVSAESAGPNRGSEFTIRLPALPAAALEAEPPVATAVARRRIVVVEDNDDVRESLKNVLLLDGHDVVAAADGRTGVELILRTRPDIALIDVGLPVLDGFAVARAIRAEIGDDIRLIAMTGYGSSADVRTGLAAGFDHYLVKPVVAATLRVLIAGGEIPVPSFPPAER